MGAEAGASKVLREALGGTLAKKRAMVACADVAAEAAGEKWTPPVPMNRTLRVFAFDPVLRLRVETERLNETVLNVRWEPDLKPGPVGEYLEVVDVDPSTNAAYAPVDLNHPHLLASDGLAPAEGVPQFHQQMVYAVAMTTIQRFEDALGRTALWAPRFATNKGDFGSQYVQRLRIYPHALREANAYYSPAKGALLFGYFQANAERVVDNLPGGLVFTCLSHDVVAHETSHALMDGIHRYYQSGHCGVPRGVCRCCSAIPAFLDPVGAAAHDCEVARGPAGEQSAGGFGAAVRAGLERVTGFAERVGG
jgi:hypothetical protein